LARYYRGWQDIYGLEEGTVKQYRTDGVLVQNEWDIETLMELVMKFPHGFNHNPWSQLQIDLTPSNI
jgi:hypothetical protein